MMRINDLCIRIASWVTVAGLAGAGLAVSAPAWAQEEAGSAPSTSDDASEEFARISDDEETIYAVQRKAYLVKDKLEVTPFVAASFADRFIQTYAPAASVTYHVAENFGLELFGAYFFPNESGLTEDILNKFSLRSDTAKLTQMLWSAGVGVLWSPIYGKIRVLGGSLGNFAFYLGVGFAVGETRVACDANQRIDPEAFGEGALCPMVQAAGDVVYEPSTFRPMAALSGGVRFNFSSSFALRFEVKDYLFTARVYRPDADQQALSDAVRNNLFAQLGVSFLFGGEDN